MNLKLHKRSAPSASVLGEFSFVEFFAGGGMARAGLGHRWKCLFANDFDEKKAASYRDNWGNGEFYFGDVNQIDSSIIKSEVDLAWASFPCQDLSLAGAQTGLNGIRSGAFWGFWKLIRELRVQGKSPKMIVLENVYGAVTSNGGRDFEKLLDTLHSGGYRTGALIIDAVHFVPQSRQRLFIIAVRSDLSVPAKLCMTIPFPLWSPTGLSSALKNLDYTSRGDWISWRLPLPPRRSQSLAELIDEYPVGVEWHSREQTQRLIEMMSQVNKHKIKQAQKSRR